MIQGLGGRGYSPSAAILAVNRRRLQMKACSEKQQRKRLGRVSTDTKGPPGIYMERAGLWDKIGLAG